LNFEGATPRVRHNKVIQTLVKRSSKQILDHDLPESDHDFRIDFIVTPSEIIQTNREGGRPGGIIRAHLSSEKISEIQILKEILS
jgi:5-formyltetrahydrofolate cyclo-ligase